MPGKGMGVATADENGAGEVGARSVSIGALDLDASARSSGMFGVATTPVGGDGLVVIGAVICMAGGRSGGAGALEGPVDAGADIASCIGSRKSA